MSLQGSVLESARFRTWLLHPSGKDVNSMCVGWTKHAFANPLAYWVRSLLPEALAPTGQWRQLALGSPDWGWELFSFAHVGAVLRESD
jgi:hypothetical protein